MSYTVYDRILESYKVEYNTSLMKLDDIATEGASIGIDNKSVEKTMRSIDKVIDRLQRWKEVMSKELNSLGTKAISNNKMKVCAYQDQIKANSDKIRKIINDKDFDLDKAIDIIYPLYKENSEMATTAENCKGLVYINAETYRLILTGINECEKALGNLASVATSINESLSTLPINYNSVFTTLDEFHRDDWKYSTRSAIYELTQKFDLIDKANRDEVTEDNHNDGYYTAPVSISSITDKAYTVLMSMTKSDVNTQIVRALKALRASMRDVLSNPISNDKNNFGVSVKATIPEYLLKAYTTVYELAEAYKTLITYEAKFVLLLITSQRNEVI